MDKDEGTKEAVRKRVGEKTELRHGERERERCGIITYSKLSL